MCLLFIKGCFPRHMNMPGLQQMPLQVSALLQAVLFWKQPVEAAAGPFTVAGSGSSGSRQTIYLQPIGIHLASVPYDSGGCLPRTIKTWITCASQCILRQESRVWQKLLKCSLILFSEYPLLEFFSYPFLRKRRFKIIAPQWPGSSNTNWSSINLLKNLHC